MPDFTSALSEIWVPNLTVRTIDLQVTLVAAASLRELEEAAAAAGIGARTAVKHESKSFG